jgi:hypothetical protein
MSHGIYHLYARCPPTSAGMDISIHWVIYGTYPEKYKCIRWNFVSCLFWRSKLSLQGIINFFRAITTAGQRILLHRIISGIVESCAIPAAGISFQYSLELKTVCECNINSLDYMENRCKTFETTGAITYRYIMNSHRSSRKRWSTHDNALHVNSYNTGYNVLMEHAV